MTCWSRISAELTPGVATTAGPPSTPNRDPSDNNGGQTDRTTSLAGLPEGSFPILAGFHPMPFDNRRQLGICTAGRRPVSA